MFLHYRELNRIQNLGILVGKRKSPYNENGEEGKQNLPAETMAALSHVCPMTCPAAGGDEFSHKVATLGHM